MARPVKYPPPERDPNWEPSEELRGKIRYMAYRWSLNRPDYQDDLYQEALLAIWLKGETEAPLNHQLHTARERIWVVRQQGKSVDGRLNRAFRRPHNYEVVHLNGYDPPGAGWSRVEQQALARLAYQELMALLDEHEIEVLELVCKGFKYPEIARQLGQYPHVPYKTMRKVKEKVRRHLRSSEEEN